MQDNAGRLPVYGSSYFNGTQEITGGWADSSGTHTNYHPVVTNIGPDIETSCDAVTICTSSVVDSSYRYSVDEFEKLRVKIENRKIDIDRLECKF